MQLFSFYELCFMWNHSKTGYKSTFSQVEKLPTYANRRRTYERRNISVTEDVQGRKMCVIALRFNDNLWISSIIK